MFSTGTWASGSCAPGLKRSETLHCNGAFRYGFGSGGSVVTVRLRGVTGEESFEVVADGRVVGSGVAGRDWASVVVPVDLVPAVVDVRFVNDRFVPGVVDRNLVVDWVEVDGRRIESEDPSVFSTGTWASGSCAPGLKRSETLHCNGAFRYGFGSGGSVVTVRLRGVTGEESFEVVADGRVVGSGVAGRDWASVVVPVDLVPAVVDVRFVNDRFVPGVVDRNLVVDWVEVDGRRIESEDPSVFSTGTWKSGSCAPGAKRSDTLHCNGALTYRWT